MYEMAEYVTSIEGNPNLTFFDDIHVIMSINNVYSKVQLSDENELLVKKNIKNLKVLLSQDIDDFFRLLAEDKDFKYLDALFLFDRLGGFWDVDNSKIHKQFLIFYEAYYDGEMRRYPKDRKFYFFSPTDLYKKFISSNVDIEANFWLLTVLIIIVGLLLDF